MSLATAELLHRIYDRMHIGKCVPQIVRDERPAEELIDSEGDATMAGYNPIDQTIRIYMNLMYGDESIYHAVIHEAWHAICDPGFNGMEDYVEAYIYYMEKLETPYANQVEEHEAELLTSYYLNELRKEGAL